MHYSIKEPDMLVKRPISHHHDHTLVSLALAQNIAVLLQRAPAELSLLP
jgi:hypothetical protein